MPDAVFIALGTNDLKVSLRSFPSESIVEAICGMMVWVVEAGAGAVPIMVIPPPIAFRAGGEFRGGASRMNELAGRLRRKAFEEGWRTVDLHSWISPFWDLESDGVHLNDLGRKKAAKASASALGLETGVVDYMDFRILNWKFLFFFFRRFFYP